MSAKVVTTNGIKRLVINVPDDVEEIEVNGDVVWAKWESEEYRYIPPAMRQFIKEHHNYLAMDGDGLIIADANLHGEDVSFHFAASGRKPVIARFDLINNPHDHHFADNLDRLDVGRVNAFTTALRPAWDNLVAIISATGYKFCYSHEGNGNYDAWWDIVFDGREWNSAKFALVVKAVAEFTATMRGLEKEHSIEN